MRFCVFCLCSFNAAYITPGNGGKGGTIKIFTGGYHGSIYSICRGGDGSYGQVRGLLIEAGVMCLLNALARKHFPRS